MKIFLITVSSICAFLTLADVSHCAQELYSAETICSVNVNFFDLYQFVCHDFFGKTITLTTYGSDIVQTDRKTPICQNVQQMRTVPTCLYEYGTIEMNICAGTYRLLEEFADFCHQFYTFDRNHITELGHQLLAFTDNPCKTYNPIPVLDDCQKNPNPDDQRCPNCDELQLRILTAMNCN